MAPLLQGFVNFRKDVHICGVIFNKVGSERHFAILQQVCDDLHLMCLGYVPKRAALGQEERYLGLDFSKQAETGELVELLENHVRWERLLDVLMACNDESFSFVYHETIDRMGNVTFFNPERDVPDFSGVDLLYLPGGYPEKHLEALVDAEQTRKAIKDYVEQGGRAIAECGGMMYLCEKIVTDDGEWPMCGVLPYTITARKADRKLSLGYRRFSLNGREYRGHEFHYTQFLGGTPPSVTQVFNARGEAVATPVLRYKHVLASYTHLYWGELDIQQLLNEL